MPNGQLIVHLMLLAETKQRNISAMPHIAGCNPDILQAAIFPQRFAQDSRNLKYSWPRFIRWLGVVSSSVSFCLPKHDTIDGVWTIDRGGESFILLAERYVTFRITWMGLSRQGAGPSLF